MKFIELTDRNGKEVWVNAERITWFQEMAKVDGTSIRPATNELTHINFDAENFMVVRETPKVIEGILCGREEAARARSGDRMTKKNRAIFNLTVVCDVLESKADPNGIVSLTSAMRKILVTDMREALTLLRSQDLESAEETYG